MSSQKGRNRWFIGKIVLLTVAMIAAVAIMIVSSILLFSDGFSWTYSTSLITSLFVLPWAIFQVKKLNGEWRLKVILDIKSNIDKSGFQWNISQDQWTKFMKWRTAEAKEEVLGSRLWSGIVAIIIFFIMAWSQFDIIGLVVFSVVCGSVFGLIIGSLMGWGLRVQLRKLGASEEGHIIFSSNAILMNDLLVSFNQMGSTLTKMELIEEEDQPMICYTVKTTTGERGNTNLFYIPVPSEDETKIDHIFSYYGFPLESTI